jgi:nucleoside-diphosphate-sugar epimerase
VDEVRCGGGPGDPDGLAPPDGERFDAVVDVTSYVSHARHALAALSERVGHWSFVSTMSVYADNATPRQRAEEAPVLPPAPDEADGPVGPDHRWYGECKVSIERAVREAMGTTARSSAGPG